MTDINNQQGTGPSDPKGLEQRDAEEALSDAALAELIELIFFAYRDFIEAPDAILRQYGFGRAHHRVLHFTSRYPGLRVADLLDILKITKQSLARVLKQLVDEGFIEQRPGSSDRRERRLFVTDKGKDLTSRLIAPQFSRLRRALQQSGVENSGINRTFLYNVINSKERDEVMKLFRRPDPEADGASGPD